MPAHWVLDRPLYLAVSFFLSSSFAVGSLSIIGIRQRDEWFLVAWQLLSLLVWGVALLLLPSPKAFEVMLILGGLAYWVLVGRWVFVSGRLARAHT
jgi:hypothetical protein